MHGDLLFFMESLMVSQESAMHGDLLFFMESLMISILV
jgi:hypothetical protein